MVPPVENIFVLNSFDPEPWNRGECFLSSKMNISSPTPLMTLHKDREVHGHGSHISEKIKKEKKTAFKG